MMSSDDDSFNDEDSFNDNDGYDSFNDADDMNSDFDDVGADDIISTVSAPYQVLDAQATAAKMKEVVADLSEMLNEDMDTTILLLRCFRWDRERLLDAFYVDKKTVMQKITGPNGEVDHPYTHNLPSKARHADKEEGGENKEGSIVAAHAANTNNKQLTVLCGICCESHVASDIFALACGHPFCLACYRMYVSVEISSFSGGSMLTCPEFECNALISDTHVAALVTAEDMQRYQRFVQRAFVDATRLLRWCPAPGCSNVISAKNAQTRTVECKCGKSFCFVCYEENHEPATCDQLAAWHVKCKDESETAHWIIANTKKCPKCFIRIEKAQGCNHMSCRSCKYEFCWVCDGDWKEHGTKTGGFYRCNKFDPKAAKKAAAKNNEPDDSEAITKTGNPEVDAKAAEAKASAKAELNRYLHYYQRYHNHDNSRKFAAKLRVQAEQRMLALQARGDDWVDVKFVTSAMDQVQRCRQVLKYTYVFAYYVTDARERALFEHLQQQLEETTERLSEMSEADEQIDLTEVANYTRVTKQYMANLLDGVRKGL